MSAGTKHLRDFIRRFRELGAEDFAEVCVEPVIVGTMIVGEVAAVPRRERRTHKATGDTEYLPTGSVIERVWPIVRANFLRDDALILVGQAASCDIVIPEYTLSQQHCGFTVTRPQQLVDLGSLNGTSVEGNNLAPLAPHALRNGDHVRMARLEFVSYTARGFAAQIAALAS